MKSTIKKITESLKNMNTLPVSENMIRNSQNNLNQTNQLKFIN